MSASTCSAIKHPSVNASSVDFASTCVTAEPNYLTYYLSIFSGFFLIIVYVAVAKLMEYIGKTIIIGISVHNSNEIDHFHKSFSFFFVAIWLLIVGLATAVLIWTDNFYLNMFMFQLMFTGASCGSIICSIATEFFPTQYRLSARGTERK